MSKPVEAAALRLVQHLIDFGRVLRRLEFSIGSEQIVDALRALRLVGIEDRRDVHAALRSVFVNRWEQIKLFDQAFELHWQKPVLPVAEAATLPAKISKPDRHSKRVRQAIAEIRYRDLKIKQTTEDGSLQPVLTYNREEVLRRKNFADFSLEETEAAKRLMTQLDWPISRRQSSRRIRNRRGRLLDLSATARRGFRCGGEILDLKWQARRAKERSITILCDISGSMERYSRMLLHFMYTVTKGMRRVEAFVFGTRLTRVTLQLRHRDIDAASSLVSKAANDWAGGTRIGEAIKAFNFNWARRVLRSSSIVLLISDGWDRGDIPLLEREMARLSRSCHRIIWLNPLLGYDDYQPLTRGMRAALPHIDDFLPVHNLESLEQLGRKLAFLNNRNFKSAKRTGRKSTLL